MPNFIVHGQGGGSRTDVDVLAVRFPHSWEYEDDVQRLKIPAEKIDVVLAESKSGRCSLNVPWKVGGDREALEDVLRRVGIFQNDAAGAAAGKLYENQRYEDAVYAVRLICFGDKRNGSLPNVTQIFWPDVLAFMHQRLSHIAKKKLTINTGISSANISGSR
ncbi:MAG TPA: hypothetical protein VJP02_03420 [Candidatus Sulfotelmatobacter sp.]|nr:hypothetical protein [Candidatus Sulfotelmatobacter sp.]